MLITLNDVSFGYDDNLIIESANFAINEGEKIGFIGANGEGKTTLIRLILGELIPVSGEIIQKNGIKIGYLEQNGGYESGATVYEEMRAIFQEQFSAIERLEEISHNLSKCDFQSKEYAVLAAKAESLQKYIAAHDCYQIDVKIKTVLNGMGFEKTYNQVIDTMSGGEKTRLKLARLLLEQPDLLILDEPTNHLDIGTLFWLEDYLSTFKGSVFVVSHDRYFLDKIVSRIVEIEQKTVSTFTGNYSKYKVLKAAKVELQQKEYEKQQEEIAKLQDYVDRNLVRASTTKMAQSRRNKLEKMELVQKPYTPPKAPKFHFTYEQQPYEQVLDVKNLTLKVQEKTLLCDANLSITRGQKVALIGENGTGKSTFLKYIVNSHDMAITLGRYVRVAYYDQENANLNYNNTVLAEMWERHVGYSQTDVRSTLARCGLGQEDMDKLVGSLSGGERAKLALCVFESEHGNFLLLDEPTNHLDLPARESLEDALKAFDGTLLFVSHDRYFISAIANKIVEIENGKLNVYEGDYAYYGESKRKLAEQQAQKEREQEQAAYEVKKQTSFRSRQERAEEAKRKERTKKVEAAIAQIEGEEAGINEQLANPAITADYTKVSALCKRLEELKEQLDALYLEYESLI
jgi:ATP-binding cassette subfamily F protein 3